MGKHGYMSGFDLEFIISYCLYISMVMFLHISKGRHKQAVKGL